MVKYKYAKKVKAAWVWVLLSYMDALMEWINKIIKTDTLGLNKLIQ